MSRPTTLYTAAYDEWLTWYDEQPCAWCYEDNAHCVCQELDERFGDLPAHTDGDDNVPILECHCHP